MIDDYLSFKRACQAFSSRVLPHILTHSLTRLLILCFICSSSHLFSFLVKANTSAWYVSGCEPNAYNWNDDYHDYDATTAQLPSIQTLGHYHINWNAAHSFLTNQLCDWLCSFSEVALRSSTNRPFHFALALFHPLSASLFLSLEHSIRANSDYIVNHVFFKLPTANSF